MKALLVSLVLAFLPTFQGLPFTNSLPKTTALSVSNVEDAVVPLQDLTVEFEDNSVGQLFDTPETPLHSITNTADNIYSDVAPFGLSSKWTFEDEERYGFTIAAEELVKNEPSCRFDNIDEGQTEGCPFRLDATTTYQSDFTEEDCGGLDVFKATFDVCPLNGSDRGEHCNCY